MKISRTFTFQAAHRLPHVPDGHKCGRMHGHTYSATIELEGDVCRAMGWVVDFAEVDKAWAETGGTLCHQTLNEIDGLENPTSERICIWLWRRLDPLLSRRWPWGNHTKLTRITISEGGRGLAIYEGD